MSRSIAAGVMLLARFRADGLAQFDASPTGLLNALAPWVAFALVGSLLALFAESALAALGSLLVSVVALLTPCVVSHALAQAWRREAAWLRYAVAITWCQWLMPPAMLAAGLCGGVLIALGLPQPAVALLAAGLLLGYALALQFFVAHKGLAISKARAALLVGAVNMAMLLLTVGPMLIGSEADT
jgi:hypothetical protein